MEEISVTTLIATLGFGIGGVFGVTAHRTNFCTMGAISDMVFMEDWNRFRAWLLAIAVAILGSQALHIAGLIDLNGAIYLTANFGWAGAIVGGLLFGFGMTMAGGCGNKTLVRLGAGNLKSLVVAIFLGMLRGLIGLGRIEFESLTMIDLEAYGLESQGMPDMLAMLTGLSIDAARWGVLLLITGGLVAFCFKSASFRASRKNIAAGLIIGALIPLAWYVTGVIGNDDFDPAALASFTFVSPVGESIQYLMTFTGATINFGIAVVGGVIFGAFVSAKAKGEFRIEAFTDASDMVRHIIGGSIMGVGGILALGCTIGQGITGMSTLAFGSVIALLSIVAGGVFGMKYLEEGSLGGAFSAMFSRG